MTQRSVVCAACFEDEELQERIREEDGPPGCDFCCEDDAPTMDIDDLGVFMRDELKKHYSFSNEELLHADDFSTRLTTWEVLYEQEQIELPRSGSDDLRSALVEAVEPNEEWCDYDPARLDENVSMVMDWNRFCVMVREQRPYSLAKVDPNKEWYDDGLSPGELFAEITRFIDEFGLIVVKPSGYTLFRGRPRMTLEKRYTSPGELGPPSPDRALQSNRMNAPGSPVFYGAETPELTRTEVRSPWLSLGAFKTNRKIRLLDLANLPAIKGTFSGASRREVMAIRFLHEFRDLITQPVNRSQGELAAYVPTQIFTDFLRDHHFKKGAIDGMRYPSALLVTTEEAHVGMFAPFSGANVVLFATEADVVDGNLVAVRKRPAWLRLISAEQIPP